LAAALSILVNDVQLRAAATVLGRQIRAEHGVDQAVCLIEGEFL